ncbi:hypothetical protein G7Y89_g11207 [Cudoniella acicularis]|uniref:NAD(P)-binding domain-containing protein n=1 Tax=Cudoniella acicularis TaxID=354080 RepID=A0A8H4RDY5_9HELO|nr:hypothetical protein G7Y89_g11207 [Cudoniella acicularis]
MKLILAGSTGHLATEIIRQALPNPAITSLICLARRNTTLPPNTSSGPNLSKFENKFKSVICSNFTSYSEDVKKELEGAGGCICRLIAVTPAKLNTMPFEETRKICQDYAAYGIETMAPLASTTKPFRFIYVSGVNAERDQAKKPWILGEYSLMRGKTESLILSHAASSNNTIQACVAKPGLIDVPGLDSFTAGIGKTILRTVVGLPKVDVRQISACLVDQAVKGFEKETLLNEDLVRIGEMLLADQENETS